MKTTGLFVAALVVCLGFSLLPAQAEPLMLKPESAVSAEEALVEMERMGCYLAGDSSKLASDSLRRDFTARLVAFLRHSDKRVRDASLNLLNLMSRDGPVFVEDPKVWEAWQIGRAHV